jgi:hypothetical protein
MDPGFHRGDDKAWIPFSTGMTGLRVDFQSTNSEPIGLEPKVVQLLFVLFISQALLNSTPQQCCGLKSYQDELPRFRNSGNVENVHGSNGDQSAFGPTIQGIPPDRSTI